MSSYNLSDFCEEDQVRKAFQPFIGVQFWFCVVVGSSIAIGGLMENSFLLVILTATRKSISKSMFLVSIAVIDISQELNYLLLISVPITAEYFDLPKLYHLWGKYATFSYVIGQITPVALSGMLIAASLDRYYLGVAIDKDFRRESGVSVAYSGDDYKPVKVIPQRLKLFAILTVIIWAIVLKGSTFLEITTFVKPNCTGFAHIAIIHQDIKSQQFEFFKFYLVPLFQYYFPFLALLLTNILIVNQFRDELKNESEHRRLSTLRRTQRDYIGATFSMIIMISTYLISNVLNVAIAMCEQIYTHEYLYDRHSMIYTVASDLSSVLLMAACAIRLPTYYLCNRHFRESLHRSVRDIFRSTKYELTGAIVAEDLTGV